MSPFWAWIVKNLYEAASSTSSSFESVRIEAPPPTKIPSLALIDLEELPPPVTPTDTTVSPPKSKPALMIGLTSTAYDARGAAAAITKARAVKDLSTLLPVILCSPFGWAAGTRIKTRPDEKHTGSAGFGNVPAFAFNALRGSRAPRA